MILVPDQALKTLLEVIDDVGWWLHYKAEEDEQAKELLQRLRNAKHDVEDQAKEQK